MPRLALRFAILALPCIASACSSGEVVRFRDRSKVPTEELETIRLTTQNGHLDVERHGELERLELEVEVAVGGATREHAEERRRATHTRAKLEHGELVAWAEFPEPRHALDAASFFVRTPRPAAVICRTSNGAIRCDGLDRSVDAETENGAVEARGRHADVRARTSNGAITITGSLGRVSATTQSGAIKVELADGASGGFELETANGAIDVSVPRSIGGAVSLEAERGSVEVRGKDIAEEGDRSPGRRRLRLAEGGAESFARTRSGSVRCRVR